MSALASDQRSFTPEEASRGLGWMDRAACLDNDTDLFFPSGTGGANILQIEEAKAVCRGCAVIDACRRYADRNKVEFGVYAGESEGERKKRWQDEKGPRSVGSVAIEGSDL